MAEFKFSCQHCGQHIQLDELWSGHEINCPACQQAMVVPRNPAAAAAPAAPAARSAPAAPVGTRIARSAESAPAVAAPAQTRFVPRGPQPKQPTKAAWGKWATIGGVVVALGIGGYFGIPAILKWQDELNDKRKAAAKNSGGGELGHDAELYKVLDATEPGGPGLGSMRGPRQRQSAPMSIPVHDDEDRGAAPAAAAMPNLPPAQAVWTLDPTFTAIPEGRANGSIGGTNFIVEKAQVQPVGPARVLMLMQGPAAAPDHELLIYLHPQTGTNVDGQTWTVAKDTTGSGVPQIKKLWKSDPKYAAQTKTFFNGYAMKLEMGETTNGTISGRIFVALPDTEQSVVAGSFNATMLAAAPTAAMAPAQQAPPQYRRRDRMDPRTGRPMQ